MPRRLSVVAARFRALLRREAPSLRQGSVALLISLGASLLAGVVLGAISDTLEDLPGLLLLIPAAVALRGNIAGTLASRLATSIHAGTFRASRRLDTLAGQNFASAIALSVVMSVVLAFIAKGAAMAFGIPGAISISDYVVISLVGGALASAIVIAVTAQVATVSARRGWDLDNVAAPIVTAAGDVVTLPSLWLVSPLADVDVVTPVLAGLGIGGALVTLALVLRAEYEALRTIVRQSLPILALAGVVSVVAGVTVEKQLDRLSALPALLILVPPFLGLSGALGGIFSSRISSKLHLGLVEAGRFRLLAVAEDLLLVGAFAVPVYLLVGTASHLVGDGIGLASPGTGDVVAATLIAGAMATAAVSVVGFFGTVAAFRVGLDPDNYAVPVVSSALDLLGAVALILALTAVGVI